MGGKCFFSSFSSQARGVAIFLKKGNTATIIDTHSDKDGNIVAILVSYQSKTILMECVYGPNEDSPNFYSESAFEKLED